MASENPTLRSQITKVRLKFASRQAPSDRFQVLGNIGPPKIISRPSLRFSRNSEHRGDQDLQDGESSSIREPSPETPPPKTINVVLFGETGVGKSSVINLIARKDIAKVSSDVNGCTMQSHCYSIPFDNMDFAIYDTIGLEEPQMGVNGYLKAIEKAHELISKLSAAGGIHLLLFCMRGGRITATTQSNYRLFCECLCNTKVPIALVFTGLEREVEMEDWWKRNKTHIEHYGIKSNGHACITAVQDDDPVEQLKYEKSKETIRELLKSCATKDEAFSLEAHHWFAGFLRKMKGFVPAKKSPKKKDILKVLTTRCKLDADTAKRIAEMMDKGDKDEEGGGGKDGPTKSPTMNDTSLGQQDAKTTSGVPANGTREVPQDSGPPQELGNDKAVPSVVANGAKDALLQEPRDAKASLGVVPGKEVAKKAVDVGVLQDSSSVKAPLVIPNGGKDVDGPAQESRSVKAPVVPGKEAAKKNVTDAGALQDPRSVKAPLVVPNGGKGNTKKNVDGPAQESRRAKAPPVVPGVEVAEKNVADATALQDHSSVKAPLVVSNGGKDNTKKNVDSPVQEARSVKAPPIVPGKEAAKKYMADGTLPQEPSGIKAVPDVPSGGTDIAKKSVASGNVPFPPRSSNFNAVGKETGKSREKVSDRRNKQGDSGTAGVTPASSQS